MGHVSSYSMSDCVLVIYSNFSMFFYLIIRNIFFNVSANKIIIMFSYILKDYCSVVNRVHARHKILQSKNPHIFAGVLSRHQLIRHHLWGCMILNIIAPKLVQLNCQILISFLWTFCKGKSAIHS